MLWEKVKTLIKSSVSIEHDDSGAYRRSISKWLGRSRQTVESLVPHGTFGMPLPGNKQLNFAKQCQESNAVVFELDPINRVVKNCKPGEYGIGNTKKKSYIYFKDNGDIEIKTGDSVFTIQEDGKFKFEGTDSVDLISTLSDWMQVMIGAKVITGIGLQPFSPDTIISMTDVKTELDKLKV